MSTQLDPKWVTVTRWAALAGDWEFQHGAMRFEKPAAPLGHGLAICDGLVRAKLRFEGNDLPMQGESAGIVLGYRSESGGYLVVGLGAFDLAYAIWEYLPAAGWVKMTLSAESRWSRERCANICMPFFRKSKPRPNSAAWHERTNESPRGVCWLLDTDSLAPI